MKHPEREPKQKTVEQIFQEFGVTSMRELDTRFMVDDQKLMASFSWNPENQDLLINQIKNALDACDPESLSEEDQEWRNEILWMWHHHAISAALGVRGNRERALEMTERALSYQSLDHPNHITQLYNFLLHDDIQEARAWAETIPDEVERETGQSMIREYLDGRWFPQERTKNDRVDG